MRFGRAMLGAMFALVACVRPGPAVAAPVAPPPPHYLPGTAQAPRHKLRSLYRQAPRHMTARKRRRRQLAKAGRRAARGLPPRRTVNLRRHAV